MIRTQLLQIQIRTVQTAGLVVAVPAEWLLGRGELRMRQDPRRQVCDLQHLPLPRRRQAQQQLLPPHQSPLTENKNANTDMDKGW